MEGGKWWNQAFEAAGFKNAFDVRELPAGAHALDVRYNMIQWVHRSTRGWSYGSSITDPGRRDFKRSRFFGIFTCKTGFFNCPGIAVTI